MNSLLNTSIGGLLAALCSLTGYKLRARGGPGATDPNAKKPLYGQADDTFDLNVPILSSSVRQGETKTVSIGIERGTNLDASNEVKLTVARR